MFYITYYARKHGRFITRKGQYDKPDGTKGKSFTSKNGVPCLVYWDLDQDGWRMATGEARVRTSATFGVMDQSVIQELQRTAFAVRKALKF